jgi:elongation factor 1 alpha-like protein
MSRHRIKALDYDEDALEDEYDEVDPEEQEQLEAYTNEVLSELRGGQPPVTSSREEVQEALWHYYNDVSKSVNYLRGGRTICQMWSILPLILWIAKKAKDVKKKDAVPPSKPKTAAGKCMHWFLICVSYIWGWLGSMRHMWINVWSAVVW